MTQRSAIPARDEKAEATWEADGPARIVFVAGISFSGSTLMGLMLGSQPNAIFGGELKDYKRRMQSEIRGSGSFCSCGKSRETCPFWSEVQSKYGRETELSPAPGFSWQNLVLGARMLLGIGMKQREVTPHGSLLKSIYEVAKKQYPDTEYVVDTSKSISNLDAIARMPGVEVSVIHLIRNGLAVGNSYQKRKSGLLYGMATWCIGNLFIRLYVRRRGLRCVTVDYRSLCLGEEATYRKLNEFLGTHLKLETATADIRNTKYHIVSGNGKVRRSASDFQGIHYSESPLKGNRFERWVANTFVRPLNRSFGVTQNADART